MPSRMLTRVPIRAPTIRKFVFSMFAFIFNPPVTATA